MEKGRLAKMQFLFCVEFPYCYVVGHLEKESILKE